MTRDQVNDLFRAGNVDRAKGFVLRQVLQTLTTERTSNNENWARDMIRAIFVQEVLSSRVNRWWSLSAIGVSLFAAIVGGLAYWSPRGETQRLSRAEELLSMHTRQLERLELAVRLSDREISERHIRLEQR